MLANFKTSRLANTNRISWDWEYLDSVINTKHPHKKKGTWIKQPLHNMPTLATNMTSRRSKKRTQTCFKTTTTIRYSSTTTTTTTATTTTTTPPPVVHVHVSKKVELHKSNASLPAGLKAETAWEPTPWKKITGIEPQNGGFWKDDVPSQNWMNFRSPWYFLEVYLL